MHCTNCGNEVNSNAPFCGNCGTRLTPVQEQPVIEQQPAPAPEQNSYYSQQQWQSPSEHTEQPRTNGNPQINPSEQMQNPYYTHEESFNQPGQNVADSRQLQPYYNNPPQVIQTAAGNLNTPKAVPSAGKTIATVAVYLGFTILSIIAVIGLFAFDIVEESWTSNGVNYIESFTIIDLLEEEDLVSLFFLFDIVAVLAVFVLMIITLCMLCMRKCSAVWKLMGGTSIALFLAEAMTVLCGIMFICNYDVALSIFPIILTAAFFLTMIFGFALSGKFRADK